MIPSLAFSLPGAVFGVTLGSVVLMGAVFLLARVPGAPAAMRLFAFAFLCNTLHYVILLLLPSTIPGAFIADQAAHGAFAMFLLAGSIAFHGRRPEAWPFVVGWAALVVYCVVALFAVDDQILRSLPPYAFVGAAMIAAGILLVRQARLFPGAGYGFAAGVLILWGLHKFDYPWAAQSKWLLTIGFIVAEILATALAVAIIVVAERTQRRLATQARAAVAYSAGRAEASAKQLEVVLGNLADGVITMDETGRVQAFNPAAEKIFGRPADEVVGRPVSLVLPEPGNPQREGGLLAAFAEDEAGLRLARECRARRADGRFLTLEITVSRVAAGERGLKIAIVRDVSNQRRAVAIDALVQEVNQRVLQGDGMEALMHFLCRRLIDLFDLRVAWVGTKESDGRVSVQGYAGPPLAESYLRGVTMRWDGIDADQTITSRAIRTGHMQWSSAAGDGSIAASFAAAEVSQILSIPLHVGQVILGALTVGSPSPIDEAGRRRLESLTARLGIAVQVMSDQRQLRLQGAAMGAAANAIVITDDEGRIEWVNDAFTRLSGYSLGEAVGKTPRLLRSGAQTDDFYRDLWGTVEAGRVWRGQLVERNKDGSLYTVEQTVTPMRDRSGRVNHFVVVHEDITERKRAEEKIKYLSSYDALTGLPNRSLFRQKLAQAIARAEVVREPLALLFLDLDHFNRINDTMGHDLGDRLLREIVDRLSAATRAADTLARVGGDEFAVIQTERATGEAAATLAQRLVAAVTEPFAIDGHEIHVGGSVGVALYPEDGADPDQLIKNADTAMYGAIREAPNGYRFFSNAMNEEMQARVGLERDLRRAVGRSEFELHYQPQLEILTGRVIGLEALLRWNHPSRGRITPAKFVPLAEESGLIVPIGDIILEMACRQIRAWLDARVPIVPVAINLSAAQLRRPGLVEHIRSVIAAHGVEPRWVELELTESAIMEDAESATRTLRALSESGIRLAIDDFGTGYSSLSYLKRFPVSKLKIDQSFVHSVGEPDGNDAAIARAIITLGHSLGLTVVSEGVDTEEQLAYLRSQGCDAVQGFLFSPPVPAAQVPALLGGPRIEAAQ